MALVYALIAKSAPDEMRYIGKTCDHTPDRRLYGHVYDAKNTSSMTYKCNWIRKVLRLGDEVLVIVLESNLTEKQSFQRETFLIDYYKTLGHRLTNQTDGGEGASGWVHTEETKRKISAGNRGKVLSEETKRKISIGNQGRVMSEEHKAMLLSVNRGNTYSKGRIPSEETKEKIRIKQLGNTYALGSKHSKESKLKNREYALGRKQSQETKDKRALVNTGKKRTNETKERIRQSQLGTKASIATKLKMSQNRKGRPWSETRRRNFDEKMTTVRTVNTDAD
jgi:hypothetical protein